MAFAGALLALPTLIDNVTSVSSGMAAYAKGGGGGGGGAFGGSSANGQMAELRIQQAMHSGADVLATACPYCSRMLNDAVMTVGVGDRIVVRDLAELLLQSVMIKDEALMTEGVDQEVCHV